MVKLKIKSIGPYSYLLSEDDCAKPYEAWVTVEDISYIKKNKRHGGLEYAHIKNEVADKKGFLR